MSLESIRKDFPIKCIRLFLVHKMYMISVQKKCSSVNWTELPPSSYIADGTRYFCVQLFVLYYWKEDVKEFFFSISKLYKKIFWHRPYEMYLVVLEQAGDYSFNQCNQSHFYHISTYATWCKNYCTISV